MNAMIWDRIREADLLLFEAEVSAGKFNGPDGMEAHKVNAKKDLESIKILLQDLPENFGSVSWIRKEADRILREIG